jgi:hypothetical protein
MKRIRGLSPDLGKFLRFDFSNFPRSGEIPKAQFHLTVKVKFSLSFYKRVNNIFW